MNHYFKFKVEVLWVHKWYWMDTHALRSLPRKLISQEYTIEVRQHQKIHAWVYARKQFAEHTRRMFECQGASGLNSYPRGIRLDLSLWSKSQRDSRLQNLLTITDWICNIRTLRHCHVKHFSVCFIFWFYTRYEHQTVTVEIHSWLQVQSVLFSALS